MPCEYPPDTGSCFAPKSPLRYRSLHRKQKAQSSLGCLVLASLRPLAPAIAPSVESRVGSQRHTLTESKQYLDRPVALRATRKHSDRLPGSLQWHLGKAGRQFCCCLKSKPRPVEIARLWLWVHQCRVEACRLVRAPTQPLESRWAAPRGFGFGLRVAEAQVGKWKALCEHLASG